ncbi:MAG: RNA polymerase sigma factor [Acetatifactor sp.]|nr:RNA polymerase sigma factor [Acetatifactor sp.]
MKNDEAITLLSDRQFLDKLYTYAYRHCNTSHEAEDLCSDMILAILRALRQSTEIQHFHAFAWTIAHRTYADYCERRKRENARRTSEEYTESGPLLRGRHTEYQPGNPAENILNNMSEDPIEDRMNDLFAREEEQEQLRQIFRQISFLSRIYRSVMVMYYLEDRKIADIASNLGIKENTVKQRLFSARNTIKKEIHKMEQNSLSTNKTLRPVSLSFIGTGDPVGNDPRVKAERILSQNLIYLCRSKARSAEELARELNVPMPYIEQELEIQCQGANGHYGMLQKTEQGKYVANILVVDKEEYEAANGIFEKYSPSFCKSLADGIERNQDKILSLKRLCSAKDSRLLLWILINKVICSFTGQVGDELQSVLSDTEPVSRPFTCVAIEGYPDAHSGFYGNDGIIAQHFCGYSRIYVENLYGNRLQPHFHCDHNISNDALLLLTIRCVGGLPLSSLSEEEQEIAAKAIQCGYLCKNSDSLEPAIVVLDSASCGEKELWKMADMLLENTRELACALAKDLAGFIKKHIPTHLMGEYPYYNTCIASNHFFHAVVEECISQGILNAPENPLGSEGVLMILTR